MKAALTIVSSLLIILYPLAIFFGLTYFEPRYLAIYLILILVLRFTLDSSKRALLGRKASIVFGFFAMALVLYTLSSNRLDGLKLYPVVVSFSLLSVFLFSLFSPPSVIERIARLTDPELPPSGVSYTRNVTKIWCGFFLLNGSIALYTSLCASNEIWVLYNGLVSYVLMGCLFAGEWIYRSIYIKSNIR